MSKGKFIEDGIVPLRGVVRNGVLAALLDHTGAEIGMPVTAQANVTGGIGNLVVSGKAVLPALGVTKARGMNEAIAFGSGTSGWITAGSGNATWQHIVAARSKPYAVRISYVNPLTSAYTVDKTSITPTDTLVATSSNDPTTGVPVNVLFSGSASVTVGAAPVGNMVIASSDWTSVSPLDRTDVIGAPFLYHFRSFISAVSGYPLATSSGPGNAYDQNTTTGLVRRVAYAGGDKIATPAGFGAGTAGYHVPCIIEFASIRRVLRVLSVGDSITANGETVAGNGGEFYSFVERAVNTVNAGLPATGCLVSHVNMGTGGQSVSQFYSRLSTYLAAFPGGADVVVLPGFSPNGIPGSLGSFNANIATILAGIQQVQAAGAVPILWTSPPFPLGGAPAEVYRLKANAILRQIAANSSIDVVDLDPLVSDGAALAGWNPGLSGDTAHPNYTSNGIFAAALASVIAKYAQ